MRVTAETKTATRQRILDAAESLFVGHGFEAATTRDIAREAGIAVGTLFNYFPTKESVALCLVTEASAQGAERFESAWARDSDKPPTLDEALFAHLAAVLRKLKPFRKYLPALLSTVLSPLAGDSNHGATSFRQAHLEIVCRIAFHYGQHEALSSVALQLYWTLFTGVLSFWAQDTSPRQEDTLALLDQSLAMFVGWLTAQNNHSEVRKVGG